MRILYVVFFMLAAACSTSSKAEITDKAMADDERRQEILEATLRVLDDNPAYVDELFKKTLRHPRTLDRFLANTARGLSDRELAERVGAHLTQHPNGLRRVMIETLDAAQKRPDAQLAIVDAMEARAKIAAKYLVDQPEKLATVSEAIVQQAIDDPNTKEKMTKLVKEIID
jgi:hypothetical protein